MNNEVLGTVVGLIFIVLGSALLTRYKILTTHRYFRILIFIVAILLLCFGVYMGWRSYMVYG
ncbi:hypothetical protein POV26_05095 [Aequorivita todarodis]|uniref:hypothetical protein n=1 Tax=Aequorivita todarodis TaxID=2036821 RepID=UPI002350DC8F|nr:hypothetical protein [Aequorivita todarodis]MDC8000401.1 hypothetical protein [Aequorivita todarodis]